MWIWWVSNRMLVVRFVWVVSVCCSWINCFCFLMLFSMFCKIFFNLVRKLLGSLFWFLCLCFFCIVCYEDVVDIYLCRILFINGCEVIKIILVDDCFNMFFCCKCCVDCEWYYFIFDECFNYLCFLYYLVLL